MFRHRLCSVLAATLLFSCLAAHAEEETLRERRIRIREERNQERLIVRAVRDSARREDNLVVSLAWEPTAFSFDVKDSYYENSSTYDNTLLAVGLAYRTHFLRMLGWQAGLKYASANKVVDFLNNCSHGCDDGFAITGEGKVLVGPFGRLVLEPTFGYTWGLYKGAFDDGFSEYRLRSKLNTADIGFFMSLYMGARDLASLTAGVEGGVGASSSFILFSVKFGYSFILPKTL